MMRTILNARWILPIASPPIENGQLVIMDGRIVAVERAGRRDPHAVDLGDAALLPGFVNAHTHLELTHAHRQVPYRGSFVRWLHDVVALRFVSAEHGASGAVADGLRQSSTAGVTTVGDVGFGQDSIDAWENAPIHVVGFLEVLGMGPRRFTPHPRSFRAQLALCEKGNAPQPRGSLRRIGLSPHAPYSADSVIYQRAIAHMSANGWPICTHLAETREETQFLADGTGPLRELLDGWGLWDGSFEVPACSPVEYARRLGLLAHEPLLVHANDVSDADLDVLAAHPCHVAYCPRSHAFFEHPPHRYRAMLDRGISVCIGTDSLASNDTLSVLDELRFLRKLDPSLSGAQVLTMGTLAGARAMGLAASAGSIEPGKQADLVALPLDQPNTSDPIADCLGSHLAPSAVYVGGQPALGC